MKKGSSRRWLAEHHSDPYVKQAREAGYRSRAVFKLQQIQQKDRLIRPGMTVIDLGSAPGGWSQYVTGMLKGRGHIVALDILPMDPIEGVEFIQGDFREDAVLERLREILGEQPVDLVLSDMAPNISGVDAADQAGSVHLAELALDFARSRLKPGGTFVTKLFQGEGFDEFLRTLRREFAKVTLRKPKASRPRSREVYLVARGPRVV